MDRTESAADQETAEGRPGDGPASQAAGRLYRRVGNGLRRLQQAASAGLNPFRGGGTDRGFPSEAAASDDVSDAASGAREAPAWPYEKFVAIVTYGRSGSTVLQTALQSMPGAFIRGENNNALFPFFHSWKRTLETRYNKGTSPVPFYGPWYGADQIEPKRFAERMARVFLEEIVRPPPGARVVGFKEIRYHEPAETGELAEYLDFIRTCFPSTRIVFNTRRAEAVARSSWWREWETERVIRMVEGLDREFAAYVAAHPDDCFRVRYEDYANDREALRPLFRFLGEAFDAHRIEEAFGRKLDH